MFLFSSKVPRHRQKNKFRRKNKKPFSVLYILLKNQSPFQPIHEWKDLTMLPPTATGPEAGPLPATTSSLLFPSSSVNWYAETE